MFERILEKVLLNVIGPYVHGIDRNNLKVGIWSGDLSIQNISVKSEVLQMLDLPVKMKYSSIGRLSLSVPWKNLGSKPVELLLKDVYIVVQPMDREEWKTLNFRTITQKLKMMDSFVQSYTNKLAQKRKQKKDIEEIIPEEQSLVARLSEKAIDNIQITIKNIHIRFEDPLYEKPYAWGITLDEILIHTTNENWETEFIDRTLSENKLLPMRKKLLLKNLGVYWASKASELFGDLAPDLIKEKMKSLILKDQNSQNAESYIIDISAECRLIQKNRKDPAMKDSPEFDVSFHLDPIDLDLKKSQVEDCVHLVELINEFQKFRFKAMNEQKREAEELASEAERDVDREEFKMLFERIRLNDEQEGLKSAEKVRNALDGPEQVQLFEELLIRLPDDDIGTAMKEVLKKIEKDKMLKELNKGKEEENQEKKENKGFLFNWFTKKKKPKESEKEDEEKKMGNSSLLWSSDEMQTLEKYIEEAFPKDDEVEAEEFRNIIRFKFSFEGGTIYLSDKLPTGYEEGVTFEYRELTANASITSQTKKMDIALKDIGFSMRTKYASNKSYIDTHVLRRVNYWLPPEQSGDILAIRLEENPLGEKEGMYIEAKLQQVELVYRKVLIERLQKYFSPATENEAVKSQYEKAQITEKEKPKQEKEPQPFKRMYLAVDIDAPVLVVPMLQNGDIKSECWVLNLGHLIVGSSNPVTEEGLLYDMFQVALTDLKLEYFPTQALYMKVQRNLIEKKDFSPEDQQELQRVFNLIERFSVDVDIDQMLPGMEKTEKGQGLPKLKVDVHVPIVHLQLRQDVYKCLLKLPDLFDVTKHSEVEMMESERDRLMGGNDKLGSLYVQEKKLGKMVWTKCECILKGSYLYLFKHEEDQKPSFTYFIRNAVLKEAEGTDKQFAFNLENKHNKGLLAAETEAEMHEWLEILVEKIDEDAVPNLFQKSKTLRKSKTKPSQKNETLNPEPVDYEVIEMKVWFQIKEVKLTVYHTYSLDKKLIELETKNLKMDLQKQHSKAVINLMLHSLEIQDYLFKFVNPDLQKLVTSMSSQDNNLENSHLIEVHVINLEQDHPTFNETMTNTSVKAKFGYLYVNFKPDVVATTMRFFLPPPEETAEDFSRSLSRKPTRDGTTVKKETTYTESVTNTLLNLNLELEEIALRLVHKKSYVCLAEVAVKEAMLNLKQKPFKTEFEGVLGNIQLFDTTNFPYTIDSNINYEKARRYELIGVEAHSQSLLEIKFKQYEPQHPEADNITHKNMFVDIRISSIRVNYFQKPVLRLIDYIQNQVVPSVTPPEGALPKDDTQIETQISEESAERTIKKPSLMDLKVYVKSPIVDLKPLPDSTEYWEARLGDLIVDNEVYKDTHKFRNPSKPLEFVYCAKYNITLQNLGIFRVQDRVKVPLTRETSFKLVFDQVMFAQEYKVLYQHDVETPKSISTSDENVFYLDERMTLKGELKPFVAIFDHDDLMSLMKILNFNITYDDGMDKMFQSLPPPSKNEDEKQKKEKKKEQTDSAPIHVHIVFDNFTLLAIDRTELPFAMINLHLLGIDVFLDEKGAMYGNITAGELNGSYFEKTLTSLVEKKMLGNMDRVTEHYIGCKKNDVVVDEIVTSILQYTEELCKMFAKTPSTEKKGQLNVDLEMQPADGDKTIRVDISGLKAFLVPDIYLNLLKFIEMDDDINPPQEKENKEDEIKSLSTQEDSPKQSTAPVKEGTLRVEVFIKDILITIPASKPDVHETPYVLALKGDILCSVDGYPAPTLLEALREVEGKTFKMALEQCTEENLVMQIKATLSECELFICEFDELFSAKDFSTVRKRSLILPFTLSFTRRAHLVPNKLRTKLMPAARNEASLELLVLRVSYQDALLLNNTIQYQLEQLGDDVLDKKKEDDQKKKDKSKPEVEELDIESTKISHRNTETSISLEESKEESLTEIVDLQTKIEDKDNWEAGLEEFDLGSQGIQIVLINDAEGNLVPVLELTLDNIIATALVVDKKVRLDTRAFLDCSYFNCLPSKWEPIIERFGLEVAVVVNTNPKLSLTISLDEACDILNINISEEMLATVHSTITTWKTDYEHKIIKKDKKKLSRVLMPGFGKESQINAEAEIEDELIEFVSPYTIVNQTGYPIEVKADKANESASLANPRANYHKRFQRKDTRVYNIENGEKAQYLIESNIEDLYKSSMQETMVGINHIVVRIIHPNMDIEPVIGIDIDRALITGHALEAKTKEGKLVSNPNFKLYAQVKLEKNSKVIILTSAFRIYNRTQIPYSVLLEGRNINKETFLEPGASLPVPIDFLDGTLCVKTKGEGAPSLKRPLSEFAVKYVEVVELQAGSSYVMFESVRKDDFMDFFEISLRPTFLVKNCCAVDISYRITADIEADSSVKQLHPQETIHEANISLRRPVYIQLRVQGCLWSEKVKIYSTKQRTKSESIPITDASGHTILMHLFCPEEELGTRKFMLYTKACILNETPYNLRFYIPEEGNLMMLPGQLPTDADKAFNKKVLLMNETHKLTISRRFENEYSGVINIAAVGSSYVELWEKEKKSMLELGLDMSIVKCDKEYNLVTKVIKISPRYVLANRTNYSIEIKREGGIKETLMLKRNDREALQWSDWGPAVKEKSISIKIQDRDNPDLWDWTKGFNITCMGSSHFVARTTDRSHIKFMKASVAVENSVIFVVIEEEKPESAAFKIRNSCAGLNIRVCQEGTNYLEGIVIKPNVTIPWSWEFPGKKLEVVADFGFPNSELFVPGVNNFKFDTLNQVEKIPMPDGIREKISRIFSLVVMEGNTRVLTFFTPDEGTISTKNKAMMIIEESQRVSRIGGKTLFNMNLEVSVRALGISLIAKLTNRELKRKQRKEVCYLLAKGIEYKMIESNENTTSQLRIKFLNLDNNTSYDTSFPVLITPTRPKELGPETRNNFLDVLISKRKISEIQHFETIQFLLAETSIKADGIFVDSVLEMVSTFSDLFKDSSNLSSKKSIAESLYSDPEEAKRLVDPEYFNSQFGWLKRSLPDMTNNIFIQNLIVNPIFINLSFQLKKHDITENVFFLANLFATAIGSAIANLDDAPLKLKGFRIDNIFDSQEAIGKKILEKVRADMMKSALKVAGSLDIVGNPVGLVSNISNGVVDLFEKPLDGFLQGPLEGGKGILKGAGSLVKNTVSGTFNSFGKITGSLASGMSSLTMDREYQASREKAKRKRPNHLGEGIYQGFSSICKGVGYGVKGVFTQPYEGAANEGFPGLLKGTFKGVTGLVTKPVTGVLEAASKTAEGVKNTAMIFDQKPNSARLRFPRAFYGRERYYKSYMDTDAEIIWLLHQTRNTKLQNLSWISAFDVFPDERDKETSYILAMSYEYVLCWEVRKMRLMWALRPEDIVKVSLYHDGMKIELKEEAEVANARKVNLINCDAAQNEMIGKKLIQLKHQVS